MSQQRPHDPIILPDHLKAIFQNAALDEIDSWSVGKLRAYCQNNGVQAQKLRTTALKRIARQIMAEKLKPLEMKIDNQVVEDLEKTVDEYKRNKKSF